MSRTIVQSIWSRTKSTLQPRPLSEAYYTLRPISSVTPSRAHLQQQTRLFQPSTQTQALKTFCTSHTMSASTIPDRYKLVFFVPIANAEDCKEAIFATGAGSFPGGKYTKCCFQTVGTGQFLPNEGADPAVGTVGALERCEEARIEVMCLGRDVMLNAVDALVVAHPYEEVAYEVYKMENV